MATEQVLICLGDCRVAWGITGMMVGLILGVIWGTFLGEKRGWHKGYNDCFEKEDGGKEK